MTKEPMTERAKESAELVELLDKLPREDRLKVEGVAVGLNMARSAQRDQATA